MDQWAPHATMLGNLILKYGDQLIDREDNVEQDHKVISLKPYQHADSTDNLDEAA